MSVYSPKTEHKKRQLTKAGFKYLLASVFCVVFSAVYGYFSHDVYSLYMIYAFAFPLVLGAVPLFALVLFGRGKYPQKWSMTLYALGIATLTVGSVMTGVFEIYGTENGMVAAYWIAGGVLAVIGAFSYLLTKNT